MGFEITLGSVTSFQAPMPHGKPRGSGSHGHTEMSLLQGALHIGCYSMSGSGMRQEGG